MKVCLLTNELYPFLPGGIGRLMHNFCEQNAAAGFPVDLHFLMPVESTASIDEIRAYYRGKAEIHLCRPLHDCGTNLANAVSGDRAFHPEFATNYKLPLQYYYGLLEAEQKVGGHFDYVEVPDLGGWGEAIISAKRAGLAFTRSQIVCRLHSSLGLITEHEPYAHHPSTWFSAVFGLEREVILNADIVIGHLQTIVDENARHYQFDNDWLQKVRIETPPILLDVAKTEKSQPSGNPDFAFSSRIQHFKRPALFVRAAVLFLEKNPDYTGKFRVLSYGWDRDLIDLIEQIPPDHMRDRILFQYEYTKEERDEILARSIVVVPSNYESLCLFAYESSLMGRSVILAQDCAGFSKAECWKHGVNCLFFDGSFIDLAKVMEDSLNWTPAKTVEINVDQPYWATMRLKLSDAPKTRDLTSTPVVYYGLNTKTELNRRIVEHQSSCFSENPAYFFVPKALTTNAAVLHTLSVNLVGFSGNKLSCSELQHEIRAIKSDFVFLIGPDTHPVDFFLASAQHALTMTPQLDLFSGHGENIDPIQKRGLGVTLSTGQNAGMALLENTVANEAVLIRTSKIDMIGFEDEARDAWFSVFCRKLALSKGNILIAPEIVAWTNSFSNERSNSKKLSGSVLDFYGRKYGLPSRLLGLDARVTNKTVDRPNYQIFSDSDFINAELAWPRPNPRRFPLVAFEPDKGGLLTHPIVGTVTVAKLSRAAAPNIQTVRLHLRNASEKNAGLCFSALFAKHSLSQDELSAAVSGASGPYKMLDWIELVHQGDEIITQALNVHYSSQVYLMAKLPANAPSEDYGWAIWRQLTLFG